MVSRQVRAGNGIVRNCRKMLKQIVVVKSGRKRAGLSHWNAVNPEDIES